MVGKHNSIMIQRRRINDCDGKSNVMIMSRSEMVSGHSNVHALSRSFQSRYVYICAVLFGYESMNVCICMNIIIYNYLNPIKKEINYLH